MVELEASPNKKDKQGAVLPPTPASFPAPSPLHHSPNVEPASGIGMKREAHIDAEEAVSAKKRKLSHEEETTVVVAVKETTGITANDVYNMISALLPDEKE